jgi:hypothetical protein
MSKCLTMPFSIRVSRKYAFNPCLVPSRLVLRFLSGIVSRPTRIDGSVSVQVRTPFPESLRLPSKAFLCSSVHESVHKPTFFL